MANLNGRLRELDKAVIVMRSRRWTSAFMDAHHTMIAKVSDCNQSVLPDQLWAKFRLHYLEGNIVCLESLRYPDHYLDMNTGHWRNRHLALITEWPVVPRDQVWARFSVWGNSLSDVGLRSERWQNRWLDDYPADSGDYNVLNKGDEVSAEWQRGPILMGTENDPDSRPSGWGQWEVQFPAPVNDSWVKVASLTNRDSAEAPLKYSYKVGLSRTDSRSIDQTVGVSAEIGANFDIPGTGVGVEAKLGSQYSATWSNSNEQTRDEETTIETSATVKAHSKIEIYQLQAIYGNTVVKSNNLEIRPASM